MNPPIREQRQEQAWTIRAHAPSADDSSVILMSASVARISDEELRKMSREDFIDVARIATPSLPQQEYHSHLPYMSREQHCQLVCLARHSCRLHTQIRHDCS